MGEDIPVGRAAIIGGGLLYPERGGCVERIPERGGVVHLDNEHPTMVGTFSAILSRRPLSYGWLHLRSQQGMVVLHPLSLVSPELVVWRRFQIF
jgi:hypothetical protein